MQAPELSIDRFTRSRHNLFSSVRLDRLVEYRDDGHWVAAALRSDSARLVPLWRSRNLLTTMDEGQFATYARAGDLDISEPHRPPTLLGSDGNRVFFSTSVGDRQKDEILGRYPQARFTDLRLASTEMDAGDAGILAYARAMNYWQYRNAFCGVCGNPNRLESAGHKLVCSNPECGRQSFPRIDPAIIVLVTEGDACLLGHNAAWPPRRFSTLAGFVEPGESFEDAVVREVFEETGVRLQGMHYVSSQPWPFPSSAMCGFYAEAADRNCSATEEMAEVRWLTPPELDAALAADEVRLPPPVSIAFRLIAEWYGQACGRDLEPLVRAAGAWRTRGR